MHRTKYEIQFNTCVLTVCMEQVYFFLEESVIYKNTLMSANS